jgi:hypothetical protein
MAGTKKPKRGQEVLLSIGEFGAKYGKFTTTARVDELLSSQFTVFVDGTTKFFFYKDYKITWDFPEEAKND